MDYNGLISSGNTVQLEAVESWVTVGRQDEMHVTLAVQPCWLNVEVALNQGPEEYVWN